MVRRADDYIEIMTFGKVEQPMFVELFGLLVGLEEEWIAQGAIKDEVELTAFEWDYVRIIGCGGFTGMMHGIKPYIVEDTKEYTISVDAMGRKNKLCKGYATIPLPIEYPVKDMDSWLKIKHRYEFNENRPDERINWGHVSKVIKEQQTGTLVTANIPGGFDTPRQLMGDEAACICYYEQPELMHDIINTITETSFKVLERVSEKIVIDLLGVHEDMAGKSGSLIGPNHILEYIKPYYRKVWDMLSSKGTKLFSQDSDGNMTQVIEAFIDCGLNVMYPAEPAAGMDIVKLREKYGNKMAFKGGIDKHVLRKSTEDIRKELEYKMQPKMRTGGTVFGLDHRIPNGTPIENYRYYVDLGREILGLPKRKGENKGWARMAF